MMWFSRRGRGGSSRCPTEITFESHDKHGLIFGPRFYMVQVFGPNLLDRYGLLNAQNHGPKTHSNQFSEIRTTYRIGPERTRTRNPGPNAGPVSKRFKGQLRSIPETFVLLTP